MEATASTTDSAAASAGNRAKQDAGHLRTDAVSLEVPVKVHGSRVTEVVRGVTPHTEPFEEQTSTMIVFPQGGVLRMATPVNAGQAVVVTNMKSRQDAICRIVKVRAYAEKQSYVEIEFTHPQPGYWGVYFPPESAEASKKAAAPPPAPPTPKESAPDVEIHARAKGTPQVSWAPAPTSAPEPSTAQPPAQARKQDSAFAQIDTREEVQPAASATSTIGDPFAARTKSRAIETAKKSSAAENTHGADVVEELTVPSSMASSAENPPATFGRFAATASMSGSHPATKEDFGARLDFGSPATTGETGKPRNTGLMIATGIAAALAIAAGVAYYLRNRPFTRPVAPPAAPIVATTPGPASTTSNSGSSSVPAVSNAQPSQVFKPSVPSPSSAASLPPSVVHASEGAAAKQSKTTAIVPSQPASEAKPKAQSPAPDMFGALNAHPVTSRRAGSADAVAAPSLDAGLGTAASSAGLSGGVGGAAGPPPPQPVAAAPTRSGGVVKPPKLISAPAAVYPNIARQAGVEGTVVVDATVGVDGKVTNVRVVSGPALLRDAALNAVRGRRYEPSTLDGQPAPADISVAIQFNR